jgi:hypothetical protein
MSALVFMDTETTGLCLSDDIWEFAAVRRNEDGTESELHMFIEHDAAKCAQLPERFRADHASRFPSSCSDRATPRREACQAISSLFGPDRPHVVGAVPNFDTERVARMMRAEWPRWPNHQPWHYHLIDVETLAVGALVARRLQGHVDLSLPWDSDELSTAVGVVPTQFERHTAMGDVRWAMAIYDAVMSS